MSIEPSSIVRAKVRRGWGSVVVDVEVKSSAAVGIAECRAQIERYGRVGMDQWYWHWCNRCVERERPDFDMRSTLHPAEEDEVGSGG
jgi:hypothetical protein